MSRMHPWSILVDRARKLEQHVFESSASPSQQALSWASCSYTRAATKCTPPANFREPSEAPGRSRAPSGGRKLHLQLCDVFLIETLFSGC